ncbi:DUF4381 domain-containing protein [Vibrio diazotrophicus]|uniref:DUF4381 domain-containing protein n=1 Tax=Vibrio diazotrophicus TaxID=685 RepID=UPI0022AED842|nr:DUF4381 domain-containing protein [Vibrio diazotrophicus]MCZ4370318.1 DUF4381 domain-containing protein [Vibrio diazotrophicus]
MIPKPPDSYMLRNIRDVELPEVFSWFPQTIGWKIVFTLIAFYSAYRIYRYAKHWWHNRYRQEAIDALFSLTPDDANWPYQMVKIVKAVMVYLDKGNAALYGVKLLAQMDYLSTDSSSEKHSSAGTQTGFQHDDICLQWLACVENSKLEKPSFDRLRSGLVVWLKTHQVKPEGEHE